MPVKSLVDLATAVVLKNLKELDSVGDYLPYENIRHILLRIDSAYQLRQIELNSPQIEGEDGEIWLKIIEREFPLELKARSYKPQNPRKWYRVWEKYKRDHDRALADSENKLRNALAGLQEDKERNTSRVVSKGELPKGALVRKKRTRFGPRDTRTAAFDFHGGKRLKLQRGADVMRKVRREASEIAMIQGRLSKPSAGKPQQRQLAQAPSTMVNDYRRAAQPDFRPKEPEPPSAVAEHNERAEFLSDSEEEEDDDEDDELFGEDDEAHDPVPSKSSRQAKAPNYIAKPPAKPVTRVEAKPRPMVSSAATSLLKKRPASASSPVRPKPVASPAAAANPARPRISSSLANKFKAAPSQTQAAVPTSRPVTTPRVPPAATLPPKAPLIDSPPKKYSLPQTQTSPPLGPSAGPSSPPPLEASPKAQPRKRKAVDVFMRPRKKMPK